MKVVKRICAVVLGSILFLAGILKLMDPLGASLVVESYFKFFHISFLNPISGFAGTFLALFETILGAAVVTGVWKKVVGMIAGIVLGFFTLITIALVIFNPQMDCGCFGEAVHLTHIQSLLKNLVLLVLWALAYIVPGKQIKTLKIKYVSFAVTTVSVCLFALFFHFSIPAIDFMDYKAGCELDATPLSFTDANGEYRDEMLLSGRTMVISVYDPAKLKPSEWVRVSQALSDACAAGIEPMVLCAGDPTSMESFVPAPELLMNMYFADRKQLMTLNRSNGGGVLVNDAQILGKWSLHSLPDTETLSGTVDETQTETISRFSSGQRLRFQAFLLYVFAVMLLL